MREGFLRGSPSFVSGDRGITLLKRFSYMRIYLIKRYANRY